MVDPDNPYTRMQRAFYARESALWTPQNRDPVVGAWHAHEAFADYDLLFDGIDTSKMVALDFGCGPGRMIMRYAGRFRRIDGADLDGDNLLAASRLFDATFGAGLEPGSDAFADYLDRRPVLYLVDGVSLRAPKFLVEIPGGPVPVEVPSAGYDLVYSTICLQHVPVHAIRLNLFREFCRVLKPGGWFTAQMGFGDEGDPRGVGYYEDRYDAATTNGGCDVEVTDATQLENDLILAGFSYTSCRVRPAGPNDWHPKWVWFRGRKPS